MLKIKEYVNYKEFYKYGFHKPQYARCLIKIVKVDRFIQNNICYEIDLETKIVKVRLLKYTASLDSTLFDLMKAGLIEVVEEINKE